MMGLTQRQADCLQAIRDLTDGGVGPSLDELRDLLNLSSKSGVLRLLKELKARGFVDWRPRHARSVHVLEPAAVRRSILERLSDDQLVRLRADAADILHGRRSIRP